MPDSLPNPIPEPPPGLGELAVRGWTIVRRLGAGGILAAMGATLPAIGLVVLAFSFGIVGPWLKSMGVSGIAVYAVGFALTAGLAILPTHVQAALGGWAFGFAIGYPAAMLGVVGAGLIGYLLALRATGDRAMTLIAEKPQWLAVHQALVGSNPWRCLLIVLLVRGALSPFALTNFVLGATRVNPLIYVVGTTLGLAPRTGAAVFFAVGLRQVTSKTPQHTWVWIAGLVVTLFAVAVIGHLASRAVARVGAAAPSRPGNNA